MLWRILLLAGLSLSWPVYLAQTLPGDQLDPEIDPFRLVTFGSDLSILRVTDDSQLMVTLYAWDEKQKMLQPVKLAEDGGLDIKGGQTVYIKWLYGSETSLIGPVLRLQDLKREVRKLRLVRGALCEWVTADPGRGVPNTAFDGLRKACGE